MLPPNLIERTAGLLLIWTSIWSDDLDNNSNNALDELGDAAAHSVLTFAQTTSAVNGTDKGKGSSKWIDAMEYRARHLIK